MTNTMTNAMTRKPSSAEAMFLLAEAYAIEDYRQETGKDLSGLTDEEFLKSRRKLEIWTLNSAIAMKDSGSWATTSLLDALKFLNGRSLEQVPNLHFLTEQEKEAGNRTDLNDIAMDLANKELRKACEAWLKDCNVSYNINDLLKAEQESENEAV